MIELRMNDHELNVERGRYHGSKREDIFFPVCNITGTKKLNEHEQRL